MFASACGGREGAHQELVGMPRRDASLCLHAPFVFKPLALYPCASGQTRAVGCARVFMRMGEEHRFDGVYHRMEDANPTERFKNGMRLTIAGTVACLDIPRRKKNKRKVGLVVQSIDATQFRMDWGPAAPEWGVATFRICDEQGTRGLKEGDTKFWKKQDSDVLLPTTPPAGGVQEPALTWSPSGKSTAWLQPPPDSPPWPTRFGIQLDGMPSEDATGSAGFASMGGEPTDAASSEQQPPRQRRRW